MKCFPRVRLQGAPHMRQGIPHLGTKGNRSHPDCALFLLADCPGRGSCPPTSWSEVDLFRAQPDASIGSTGLTVFAPSSSAVSVFIARTIVKHLSTGPCTGKASRVERPVALCGRGQAFGRRPKPAGYTLSTVVREIYKLSETGWNMRAPLSPSYVLVHRVVLLHVVQQLNVSHINICPWILRRVSNVWLQTSSLELIRALPSLPPFCTILHKCINFRLRLCFLSDNAINSFLKSKTNSSPCSLKCAIQSWHCFHHAWTSLIPDPRYFFSSYGSVAALSKSRPPKKRNQLLWLDWRYLQKEDSCRAEKSFVDGQKEEAPADVLKQWQEARANRRMQFKVGNYRDGDWVSNIRMLTGTIKADWIQLPVERYLAAFLHWDMVSLLGNVRNKGCCPLQHY